jgi:transposase
MKDITTVGIDLAKNTFQIIGLDSHDQEVLKKRCKREGLMKLMRGLPACRVYMEACGTSNYWARVLTEMGHAPKLISPQKVTPYVENHKNDYKDTQAILEAGSRPRTKFVSIKTQEQQDIQSLLRVRERLVHNRVSLSNQLRALLLEYGIVIPQGFKALREKAVEAASDESSLLSDDIKALAYDLYEEFEQLSDRLTRYDQKINQLSTANENMRLLRTIPGIGPITSAALYAAVGNGSQFKNGREMAAQIGLVPKQHSSGDKQMLLGITQKGDRKLKQLLIHGARAVVKVAPKKTDRRSNWINQLLTKKHSNVVATALANRAARIAWAVLQSLVPYNPEHCQAHQGRGGAC